MVTRTLFYTYRREFFLVCFGMSIVLRLACMSLLLFLGGCLSDYFGWGHTSDRTKFAPSSYGVSASPRVTHSRYVRKGGGYRHLGDPYKINGNWYHPKREPNYVRTGRASWYGPNFHGRLTANGEVYDQYGISGAHPTFPLPSYARVTNLENGSSLVVRINDRGPFHRDRVIDLSAKAAELLDYRSTGTADVRVEYMGDAPLHGRDHHYLLASYTGDSDPTAPIQVASLNPKQSVSSPTYKYSFRVRRPSIAISNTMLEPMSLSSFRAAATN